MIRYIELKSGHSDNGPAWIARVMLSKTGRTVYFGSKALRRGAGGYANHTDVETSEAYWVSGVKKDGADRHWAGSGPVMIERSAVEEYLREVGRRELDPTLFKVIDDLEVPDPSRFDAIHHRRLHEGRGGEQRT